MSDNAIVTSTCRVECEDEVLEGATNGRPAWAAMMSVFEAWEKPAVTWTCRLGSKRCRCAMAPAIGTTRPVCVEKLKN